MLFDEPEDNTKPSPHIDRMRRGDGRFVMVRFRNKADLDKFADILEIPHIKAFKKGSHKIKWSADTQKNNPLGDFM